LLLEVFDTLYKSTTTLSHEYLPIICHRKSAWTVQIWYSDAQQEKPIPVNDMNLVSKAVGNKYVAETVRS
jgi:hypothetical protein